MMAKKLTQQEITAARVALSHAEADAEGGGEWDDERSKEIMLGVKVLTKLLNNAISKHTQNPEVK